MKTSDGSTTGQLRTYIKSSCCIFHKANHQLELMLTIKLCMVDFIHIPAVDGFIIPAIQYFLEKIIDKGLFARNKKL